MRKVLQTFGIVFTLAFAVQQIFAAAAGTQRLRRQPHRRPEIQSPISRIPEWESAWAGFLRQL